MNDIFKKKETHTRVNRKNTIELKMTIILSFQRFRYIRNEKKKNSSPESVTVLFPPFFFLGNTKAHSQFDDFDTQYRRGA